MSSAGQPILILNCEEHSRSQMGAALTDAGYQVAIAASLAEAEDLIRGRPPALIICGTTTNGGTIDLSMLGRLRSHNATAGLPFIALGNYFDASLMRQAMDLGADDFLVEPLSAHQVVASIDARLSRVREVLESAARAQDQLASMVEDAPLLFALCEPDEMRFEFISGPGRKMLNLNPTVTLSDVTLTDLFSVNDPDALLSHIRTMGNWHGDATMRRLVGPSAQVSLWITWHQDSRQTNGYISVIAADISKRREAEEALRKNELLLRAVTDHATEAISVIDEDNNVVWSNPAYGRCLGTDSTAPTNLPNAFDRVHTEDRLFVRDGFSRARETGMSGAYAFRVPTSAQPSRTFEAIATKISSSDAQQALVVQFARDITERIDRERERAEAHVSHIQAQKLESMGQLAAGIAHEINTPIQFIGDNLRFLRDAFTDVLRLVELIGDASSASAEDAASPEATAGKIKAIAEEIDLPYLQQEIPEALNQSIEGVQRVAKLVQAMKVFSHPGDEERAPADLNSAIRNTVEVTRNAWKYVADVDLQLDSNLPMVPCHIGEISQVILNLVVNAAHAITEKIGKESPEKGRITITTSRDASFAEFRVGDTGTGIDASVMEHLFEPFFTTKPVGQGTGQGLAIARGVVERHGGTIEVESHAGAGACFIVRLPLEAPVAARKSA